MAETLRQANRASAKTINPRRRASWHNGAALTGAPTLSRASWRQLAHYIPAPRGTGAPTSATAGATLLVVSVASWRQLAPDTLHNTYGGRLALCQL